MNTLSIILLAIVIGGALTLAAAAMGDVREAQRRRRREEAREAEKAATECLHVWCSWEVTHTAMRYSPGSDRPHGINIYQARQCVLCGLTESRKDPI